MTTPIVGISSMAMRPLLTALLARWQAQGGQAVSWEAVGGVAAAERVQNQPASFDVVFLAEDALARLATAGCLLPGSVVPLVRSQVAVAVPAGAPVPDLATEASVRAAVLAASRIGYSTGPSGVALLRLFEQWGDLPALQDRLVQAPPGVPVGRLLAEGQVDLGFQQRSELLGVDGITLVGDLPAAIAIETVFGAAIVAESAQAASARDLLAFLASPAVADDKVQVGMMPA